MGRDQCSSDQRQLAIMVRYLLLHVALLHLCALLSGKQMVIRVMVNFVIETMAIIYRYVLFPVALVQLCALLSGKLGLLNFSI